MSRKLATFKMGKYVHMVAFFLVSPLGGGVEEIGDFQDGKIRSHGTIFLHHPFGGMSRNLMEFDNFQKRKYVHMVPFILHHLLGAMSRNLAIFKNGKTFTWYLFFITSWGRDGKLVMHG